MKKNLKAEQAQKEQVLEAQRNASLQELENQLTEKFGAKYQELKKQYAPRKLNVIKVEDKVALLRPIGAAEVSTFSMMTVNPEMGLDKASEYLINELWLDGDMEIVNDEEYFISAMLQLQNVVELKKSAFYKV
jgi:hypothetical protein